MAVYGYARVSTKDQDCAIQVAALKAAGCAAVRDEKKSGTSRDGRTELETLMTFMRAGDTLMVTRIDRLARSLCDLQLICKELEQKGIALKATEQSVDTSTPEGRALFGMLGVFAQFETEIRKERQAEGIARAKRTGDKNVDRTKIAALRAQGMRPKEIAKELGSSVYAGRKASIDRAELAKLKGEGLGVTAIARQLGISRESVYRILGQTAAE